MTLLPVFLAFSMLPTTQAGGGTGGVLVYHDTGIKDAYVVVLDGAKPEEVDTQVDRLVQVHAAKHQFTYRHAVQGFAATMTENVALTISQDPAVAYVAQQQALEFTGEQTDASWNLGILDQRSGAGTEGVYRFGTYGEGVHAYIMDSGLRHTHSDFGGRATGGVSFVPHGIDTWGTGDCAGHGTAMAGVVGGERHGVAKLVRLHGLRIGGCVGGGRTDLFLAAADWLAVHAQRPAVVNMSFQGRADPVIDAAVTNLLDRNITVVASAGNANLNACDFSPSRVPGVITVAAMHAFRDRLEDSSWGPCVDLFAPGEQVPSTGHGGDNATTMTSGTSAAAAHVTGAAARFLERFPTAWPGLVESVLKGEATKDQIDDPRGSPNLILYLHDTGPGNDGYGRAGADVNGDGRDDIVTFVRGTPADVWVALSTGTGFGPGLKWHEFFGAGNEIPMLGDVNRDGRSDLITFTRGGAGDVFVALSTGTSFGPSTRWHDWFAVVSETPLVGDFDGDGRDDIATLTRRSAGDVFVAISDGTQFVGTGVKWSDSFAHGDPAVLAGDVTCDGRDDLVAFGRGTLGQVTVAVSLGSSFATPGTVWRTGLVTGTQVPVVGDFNGDGCADVAAFDRGGSGDVYVALSVPGAWGVRTFAAPTRWHLDFAGGVSVPGAGDFTGDGRDDVVAFTRGQAADVYVAPSSGSWFATGWKWSDWFAFGLEVPMPASLW